jgi:hypothetical protein
MKGQQRISHGGEDSPRQATPATLFGFAGKRVLEIYIFK